MKKFEKKKFPKKIPEIFFMFPGIGTLTHFSSPTQRAQA